MKSGKWCFSIYEGEYEGSFDTEEEAHAEAKSRLDGLDQDLHSYDIAIACHPLDLVKAEWVGNEITEEICYEMMLSSSHEYHPLEPSKEDKEALGNLVINFIRERIEINYYCVIDVKSYPYFVEDEV